MKKGIPIFSFMEPEEADDGVMECAFTCSADLYQSQKKFGWHLGDQSKELNSCIAAIEACQGALALANSCMELQANFATVYDPKVRSTTTPTLDSHRLFLPL